MSTIRPWDPSTLEVPPTRVGWAALCELVAADTAELMVELDIGVAACDPPRALPFALTADQAEAVGWALVEHAAMARMAPPITPGRP